MRSGGRMKRQDQALKRRISPHLPTPSASEGAERKKRRTGDGERDDVSDRQQTPNAQPAAGTPYATCSFLQVKVCTLTRDRHMQILKGNSTSERLLPKTLEKMERECDGVHRSQEETEERILELKAKDKMSLVREYVDRLHGGKILLSDKETRKELRKLALREEDEEEYMEGQELFKSP